MDINTDEIAYAEIAALELRRRKAELAYRKGLITPRRMMAETARFISDVEKVCRRAAKAQKAKRCIDDAGRARSAEVRESMADADAKLVLTTCIRLGLVDPDGGRVNCQVVADALNLRGIKTPRGNRWPRAGVKRALERAGYRFKRP